MAFILTVELMPVPGTSPRHGYTFVEDDVLEEYIEIRDKLADATAALLRLHPMVESVSIDVVD
jgi:hypothetical protein